MRLKTNSATGIDLRQVLPHARYLGGEIISAASVCGDWRRCREGDLYVALLEADGDGHDYAAEAVARGALAVVAERMLPLDVPQILVPDSRHAYGHLCHALLGDPSRTLRLVGVTGSRGKTVTSLLLGSIIEAAGFVTGVSTSLACSDGRKHSAPLPHDPSPVQLAAWCARTLANGGTHGVVELSSQALAHYRTAGLHLEGAVLTNLGREHAARHGTLENYHAIQRRIFDHLKPRGFAVLNHDDRASQAISPFLPCPVLAVSAHEQADVTATLLERSAGEQTFLLHTGDSSVPVRTRMVGNSHLANCLEAAAAALVLGIELPAIAAGLEAITAVPGRLERIECGQPFGVFVDSARSPSALANSLRTLREFSSGRITCVFGSPSGMPRNLRAELGATVERLAHRLVITSDNPRYEEPLRIAHEILDGVEAPAKAHIIPDRQRAIEWSLAQARPGDLILIAGKGDEPHQIIGKRRFACDDRATVRETLYQSAAQEKSNVWGASQPPQLRVWSPKRRSA